MSNLASNQIASTPYYGEVTEDEYQAMAERAKRTSCPQCLEIFERANGHRGPKQKGGSLYCSERCVQDAAIKLAPKRLIEPPAVQVSAPGSRSMDI
jgi:hypothetical protein